MHTAVIQFLCGDQVYFGLNNMVGIFRSTTNAIRGEEARKEVNR